MFPANTSDITNEHRRNAEDEVSEAVMLQAPHLVLVCQAVAVNYDTLPLDTPMIAAVSETVSPSARRARAASRQAVAASF